MFKALIVKKSGSIFWLVFDNNRRSYEDLCSIWASKKWYENIPFEEFACFEYRDGTEIPFPSEPFDLSNTLSRGTVSLLIEFTHPDISFVPVSWIGIESETMFVNICLQNIGLKDITKYKINDFFHDRDVCKYDENSFFNGEIIFQDNLKTTQIKNTLTFIGGNGKIVEPFFQTLMYYL